MRGANSTNSAYNGWETEDYSSSSAGVPLETYRLKWYSLLDIGSSGYMLQPIATPFGFSLVFLGIHIPPIHRLHGRFLVFYI